MYGTVLPETEVPMLYILAWAIIVTAIAGGLGFLAASRRDSDETSGFLGVFLVGVSVPILAILAILLALGTLLSSG